MPAHLRRLRIYLEDTDAQGVVYHVNYLKYCERSRTDILLQEGFRLSDLQEKGWTLVVYEMRVKYKRPARLHDELVVQTTAKRTSDFRISFAHAVYRDGEEQPLLMADVDVVAVDAAGRLIDLPEDLLIDSVG